MIRDAVEYVDHPLVLNDDGDDDDQEGREEVGDEENERINAERRFRLEPHE